MDELAAELENDIAVAVATSASSSRERKRNNRARQDDDDNRRSTSEAGATKVRARREDCADKPPPEKSRDEKRRTHHRHHKKRHKERAAHSHHESKKKERDMKHSTKMKTPSLGMLALSEDEKWDIEKGVLVGNEENQHHGDGTTEDQPSQPGAVAVPGLDGDSSRIYSLIPTSVPLETPVRDESPVQDEAIRAERVDIEEENRKRQEQVEKQVQDALIREREQQRRNTVVARVVGNDEIRQISKRRRIYILTGSFLFVVLAAVGIVLGLLLRPVPTPPSSPDDNETILQDLIELLSNASYDGGTALSTQSTPQSNALNWLAGNANLANYTDETKLQRFALATLFYSTTGYKWDNYDGWLSDKKECDWYNEADEPFCSSDGNVVLKLDLGGFGGNHLEGGIPEEIGLTSLGKCNRFTSTLHHTIRLTLPISHCE